jgi:alkylhydroperoxidase family enzyme
VTPRIPPLRPDERSEQQRELLGGGTSDLKSSAGADAPASNIFATLARHPGLYRHWLPFGGKLLAGKLPPRDRELLILRTGWNCRSDYEWGQHEIIAAAVGLSNEEIARVPAGPDAEGWDDGDRLLLRAADELHEQSTITDATWAALADRYDERQMIELPMLVGHYHLVAMTLNALGIEREEGVGGLPE